MFMETNWMAREARVTLELPANAETWRIERGEADEERSGRMRIARWKI